MAGWINFQSMSNIALKSTTESISNMYLCDDNTRLIALSNWLAKTFDHF
jgi:hypothetical protein